MVFVLVLKLEDQRPNAPKDYCCIKKKKGRKEGQTRSRSQIFISAARAASIYPAHISSQLSTRSQLSLHIPNNPTTAISPCSPSPLIFTSPHPSKCTCQTNLTSPHSRRLQSYVNVINPSYSLPAATPYPHKLLDTENIHIKA